MINLLIQSFFFIWLFTHSLNLLAHIIQFDIINFINIFTNWQFSLLILFQSLLFEFILKLLHSFCKILHQKQHKNFSHFIVFFNLLIFFWSYSSAFHSSLKYYNLSILFFFCLLFCILDIFLFISSIFSSMLKFLTFLLTVTSFFWMSTFSAASFFIQI